MDGYVSSLPEEVYLDLAQYKLTKLASLWELVSGPNKRKFFDLYGQIASLIAMEVDKPLSRPLFNSKTPYTNVSSSTKTIWCPLWKNTQC